jgi:hypothetical protein
MDASSGIGRLRTRGARRAPVFAIALLAMGSCGDVTHPSEEEPTITTEALADGAVGVPYWAGLTATGGQVPYGWTISAGSLPAGLVLEPSTGVITGTPTAFDTLAFTVQVTGDDGLSSAKALTLAVGIAPLQILLGPLPDGVLDVEYSVYLRASGGSGRYGWSVVSGSLPGGVSLSDDVVSGQPTESGYFPIGFQVESDGVVAVAEDRIRVYPTQNLRFFLEPLPSWIASSLQYNQDLLPRNPHLASEIEAKTELLSSAGLEASILNEGLFEEREVTTLDGRSIPVAVVFPADTMRWGAQLDLDRILPTVTTLEELIGVPWPRNYVQEWYGFRLGNSGGGGSLYMEDRGTYADRAAPYDVIVSHELGHTYIGHEGLTQFLEVYGYNVVETGSTDLATWPWKRTIGSTPYVPFASGNEGAWALMDIYQLIGAEAMGRAYARIHVMGAPYGAPLSDAARQTFVDEAPASVRDQVAGLVVRI